jgi:hypothetical protein
MLEWSRKTSSPVSCTVEWRTASDTSCRTSRTPVDAWAPGRESPRYPLPSGRLPWTQRSTQSRVLGPTHEDDGDNVDEVREISFRKEGGKAVNFWLRTISLVFDNDTPPSSSRAGPVVLRRRRRRFFSTFFGSRNCDKTRRNRRRLE